MKWKWIIIIYTEKSIPLSMMEQVPEVPNPAVSELKKASRSDPNETPHLLNFCDLTVEVE